MELGGGPCARRCLGCVAIGKGINPPAQCARNFFLHGTRLLLAVRKNEPPDSAILGQ